MEKNQRIIYGIHTDNEGRCVHYHSEVDVVANMCAMCHKFYACYKCHDELEDHPFEPVESDEEATAMCGACGKLYSYKEYACLSKCTGCGHEFNPRCALHKSIYARTSDT